MLQPHFHHERLALIADAMLQAIEENLDLWETAAANRQPLNVLPGFSTITMSVITRTLFGQSIERAERLRVGRLMDC